MHSTQPLKDLHIGWEQQDMLFEIGARSRFARWFSDVDKPFMIPFTCLSFFQLRHLETWAPAAEYNTSRSIRAVFRPAGWQMAGFNSHSPPAWEDVHRGFTNSYPFHRRYVMPRCSRNFHCLSCLTRSAGIHMRLSSVSSAAQLQQPYIPHSMVKFPHGKDYWMRQDLHQEKAKL